MELLADRDLEVARKILDPVLERMMDAVHRYAALRMQESIRRYTEEVRRAHGVEVQIRVGLNLGEVVVRSIGSDQRGEKSFELRATTALSRLLTGRGRRDEARRALSGIQGRFSEGFDTADLRAARALLDELG